MVFSSLTFLFFFLPIVCLLYFISPTKIRNVILLFSGLFFYAWGEPIYVLAMIGSTAIDYTAGRFIDKFDNDERKRKIFLLVSVVMNLSLLGVFKYSSFLIGNVNEWFALDITDPKLPLPIGISFYTFQSMSYTIDLYRRQIKVQKNFFSFASYVSLFPQIVAGPIVRYEDVANEIDNRKVTIDGVSDGVAVFLKGLAKKVLIANNIGLLWTTVKAMDYATLPPLTAWIGILAFTFQIYFDFSGYSDMAVGLGKILGFNFPKNFDHPYMSKSVTEFWRRWHITLGAWFRLYVYIPLGGNRKGLPSTVRNLLITWALTGLWHGASWNFVLWGLFYGVLIVIERLGFGKVLEKAPAAVSTLYTFLVAVFGWVLFETNSLAAAGQYFAAMFGAAGVAADDLSLYLLSAYAIWFIIAIAASGDGFDKATTRLRERKERVYLVAKPLACAAVMFICTAYLVTATYNPFLYFRF
jgi:alginate O-acetyltransferase complex protein AlgI